MGKSISGRYRRHRCWSGAGRGEVGSRELGGKARGKVSRNDNQKKSEGIFIDREVVERAVVAVAFVVACQLGGTRVIRRSVGRR